jgi:[acyl-carrier-protein] S-malonyltransferase
VAAGALNFAAALRLVDVRAHATQAAALEHPGGLLACLGGDAEAVLSACRDEGAHVANDNAPGQLVIAGTEEALALVARTATEAGARTIRLDVGAAYHSPHMQPAIAALGAALDEANFRDATIPVVANADAKLHSAARDWPRLLRTQLVSPVRWRESVATLADAGVSDVVELGASPVLTALVKRTAPELQRHAIHTPEQMEAP